MKKMFVFISLFAIALTATVGVFLLGGNQTNQAAAVSTVQNDSAARATESLVKVTKPAPEAAGAPASEHQKSETKQQDKEEQKMDEAMAAYLKTANPKALMDLYAKKREARAALIQARMDKESPNPVWNVDIQNKFAEMGHLLPGINGVALQTTDCRESICALHLAFNSADDLQKLSPMLEHAGAVMGTESWLHPDSQGQGPILYLAKQGASLPGEELLR